MNDEVYYSRVADELIQLPPIAGLWAKAFAECDGKEPAARALYLRLRVAQLIDVDKKQFDADKRQLEREKVERLNNTDGSPSIPKFLLFTIGASFAFSIVFLLYKAFGSG